MNYVFKPVAGTFYISTWEATRIILEDDETVIWVPPAIHEPYIVQRDALDKEMKAARKYSSAELIELESKVSLQKTFVNMVYDANKKAKELRDGRQLFVGTPDYASLAVAEQAIDNYRLRWADGIAAVAAKIAVLEERMRVYLLTRVRQ